MGVVMDTETLASQLAALGNPTRLAAFRLMVRAGSAGLPVGALQQRLDLPPSTLSHHLAHLVRVGLVDQQRQGTTLICRPDLEQMTVMLDTLRDECCADLEHDT